MHLWCEVHERQHQAELDEARKIGHRHILVTIRLRQCIATIQEHDVEAMQAPDDTDRIDDI